jgi:NADPH-dependent curcumin reductase CurA
MPLPSAYKQYIFDERPTGHITPTTFKSETKSTSDLKVGPGQVLIKVTWISLDPAMRSWLNDNKRAYTPPVKLGEVMRAAGLGVVAGAGEGSKFSVGDEVSGVVGGFYLITLPLAPGLMAGTRRLERVRRP